MSSADLRRVFGLRATPIARWALLHPAKGSAERAQRLDDLRQRFTDRAAMDRHNGSAVVARFFGIAKPLLDGAVTLVTSSEISAKG